MELDEKTVQLVWEKGRVAPDRPAEEWRKDECGAWMHRDRYENERSQFGWKVQNTAPGAGERIENLRPFQIENGYDIANDKARCRVTADREGLVPTQHVVEPRNKTMS